MLDRHQEAPDSFETTNLSPEINWERLRDAPLVGINGIIVWNQIERERFLGIESESNWTEDDNHDDDNGDDESVECLNEDEVFYYENYDEQVHEYLLEQEWDGTEWIPYDVENDEIIEMMVVD